MRNPLHFLTVVAIICLWTVSPACAQTDATAAKEYQIKAAFLYNFVKFVTWPGEKALSQTHRADICVLGEDPFGSALDVFRQASTSRLTFDIEKNIKPADIPNCNILFIAQSEQPNLGSILAVARATPILTVSELSGFADKGGIIEMVKTASAIGLFSKDKINLRINVRNAEAQNLHIDPQLLEIAAEVIK